MIQTAKAVLSVCLIFCLVSCVSCKTTWDWEPDPWEASHLHKDLMNKDEKVCACSDICFDDFTCFPSENIKELKINIARLDISREEKDFLLKEIDKIFK